MIEIIATFFDPKDSSTNVVNMIRQDEYKNTLFIFNDNFMQYGESDCAGGGNAVLRIYKVNGESHISDEYKRAWGIPTGPGFNNLESNNAKERIDTAIQDIKKILMSGKYDKLVYSGEVPKDDDDEFVRDENNKVVKGRKTKQGNYYIGAGIFTFGDDVKYYIADRIKSLEEI